MLWLIYTLTQKLFVSVLILEFNISIILLTVLVVPLMGMVSIEEEMTLPIIDIIIDVIIILSYNYVE